MSRYALPLNAATLAAGTATDLAIGWDRPLDTYFLTLLRVDTATGGAEDLIWIGTDHRECQDVDHILHVAADYSDEAGGYRDRLLADRAREGSRARSPLLG